MADLRITHLYPRRMNIYGDRGNIVTLVKRLQWRGVSVEVAEHEVGDTLRDDADLYFFGGGQDQEQDRVAHDLAPQADALKTAVADGAAVLAVCGGYQLLGKYYQPDQGERLPGVGIFNAFTEGGPKRLIGNVVGTMRLPGYPEADLVGFENHSGVTHLAKTAVPLAQLKHGFGNTGKGEAEGCIAGTAIGTYLHGSLLPKNPVLADWLLEKALRRRRQDFELKPLEDEFEQAASTYLVKRFAG